MSLAELRPSVQALPRTDKFRLVQELIAGLAQNENSIPGNFQFADRFTLLRASQLVALICPRPLQIQAGANDDAEHRDRGKQLAPDAAAYYNGLNRGYAFQFLVFPGGHEFYDPAAWDFVQKHL